jgi:ComF family protein
MRPPPFRSAVAAGVYEGVLRRAIHALKYRGVGEIGVPLGMLAAAQLGTAEQDSLVVPVPAHSDRKARRGIDHAALIAIAVADAAGLEIETRGLVRVRATLPQYSLTPDERRKNVAGAFKPRPEVLGRVVILVDDVHTTGATARECAATLLSGGASAVDVCTVARAVGPRW